MDPATAAWHVVNLFAVPLGLGLLAPTLAKLLWRDALRGASWFGLVASGMGLSAAVAVGGLVVSGRDGMMATYAAMVGATALLLWWRSRG